MNPDSTPANDELAQIRPLDVHAIVQTAATVQRQRQLAVIREIDRLTDLYYDALVRCDVFALAMWSEPLRHHQRILRELRDGSDVHLELL